MTQVPVLMRGLSMAPWLVPRDVLMVEQDISLPDLREGDVILLCQEGTGQAMVHRVVGHDPTKGLEGLRTKGDRNRQEDRLFPYDWRVQGKVVARFRTGQWKRLEWGRALAWFSKKGLYPGQRLPKWLSRVWHPNWSDWFV